MSYASFASLDEAWGGIGINQPPGPPPVIPKSSNEPLPSDVDYNRIGAPIMDDIVNLYTPADSRPDTKAVRAPQETKERVEKVVPTTSLLLDKTRNRDKKVTRKGDDYSDSESDNDSERSARIRFRQRRMHTNRRRSAQGVGDDTSQIIELAAYVLSGVMLIFLFESFITIGGNLRAGSSYY